jgi:hypothetical protein
VRFGFIGLLCIRILTVQVETKNKSFLMTVEVRTQLDTDPDLQSCGGLQ